MYDIEIDYTTGSSFGSERVVENLCNPVSSLDKAKGNLERIKTHYLKYSDSHDYGVKYNLTLMTDGGERSISPFWIGYFETLHGAKIVIDGESDTEFTL